MIPEGAHRGTNGLTPRGFHADARGERTSLAPRGAARGRPMGRAARSDFDAGSA